MEAWRSGHRLHCYWNVDWPLPESQEMKPDTRWLLKGLVLLALLTALFLFVMIKAAPLGAL